MKRNNNSNVILEHYLNCALWSSTDDNDNPLDENYDIDDIDQSAKDESLEDINGFLDIAGTLLDGQTDEQIGHDFWLTRNGHGAGFWDRGLEHGDELTKLCEPFGSVDLYAGDDGKLHVT